MFLRSCLSVIALVGAMSASAVELFWVGESQPQRFDTRMLSAKGFGAAVVHDGGRLTSDASWSADAVHIVYGTLVVETNVTLTIQAGAVVQFAGGGIYVRGDCVANGVHFADAASDEVVSYVLKGNVVTDEATTFKGRDYQDDFQRHSDSSSFAFDTRGLLGEAPSGTVVHWGGRLSENETWAAGQTHLVYGSVTVPTNVTLTVERGAVVKFAGGGIRADGSLVAEGVAFTDLDDDSVGGDTRKDGWSQPHVSYAIDGEVHDDANTVYRCLDTHGEWLLDGASVASAFNTRGYGAADLAGAVTHEGAVTSNEAWSADETHVVYGTLHVAAGVTLTIEPGAVVKFVGGGLVVDGRCVARGVTFTDLDDDSHGATRANAKLPEASYVLEGEIETDYATVMMCSKGKQNDLADPGVSRVFRLETDLERVRFAGVPREVTFSTAWDGSTAVEVTETRPDGSTVVLTNETADCAGVFLWDAGETPGLYTLRHVTDTNELSASFYRLFSATVHSGSIRGDMVWEAGITHVVDGSLKVMSGATLLIEPGAVVKFVEGASLTVADGGSCVAKDVTFTPLGDDTVGGDTMFDGNATMPTQDAYVVNGVEDDETTEYRYMTPPSLVTSGTVNKDTTWKGWNVYRITGDLTIASGVTLTIMPGAIVKFDDGKSLTVNSGATLNAIGTRAQPIVFTSVKDDTVGGDTNGDGDSSTPNPGDWSKISTSGGTANMAHVQILYSSKNSTTGAINMNGGTVTFVDGLIAHGLYDAIGVESGHFHMSNSVVCDCLVACRHWPRDPIVNCVFYDCGRLTQGGGQTFVNCIFSKITETWEAFGFPQNGTTYRNCCFWNKGGSVLTGEGRQDALTVCGKNGNIWGDPLFEDPDNGDFRIKVGSPCFDAGDDASAPERDHYNQPRNGQADIGIFELQYRAVKADIDLSLVSVAADASATIGGTLNVSWTVENLGSANATGSWRDTFELIDASGATIKLGSYTVSGGIVAGGKRVFTTKFNVPSAAVGAARLRVKVNAERDVFEGMIMDNNVAFAGGTIDLALVTYTPDECSTLVVGAGSSTALTIPADSGITALIIKGGAGVSAYGAYGYLPKALRNDSAAVRLEDGSLLLTLPSTDSADDFTFVIANGGYGAETVSVEPVTESLEVTEVAPNRLANTGDGYLTLRGIALDRVAQVRLVGGATFAPTAFSAASSGELSATFPLADATPGIYALEVEDADGETYRLDAAVEIYKPKMGPKLEAHLEIPTAVRQGRIYTGKIVYSNVGDTDMYAPWLLLEMSGATIFVDGQEFDGSFLEVVGISASYPQGILKAGEANELEITFRCDSSLNFSLSTEEYRPDDKGVAKLIADTATRVNKRGRSVYLLGDLMRYLESTETDPNKYAVSGVLLEEVDGSPLAGVELGAYDSAGGCASSDTVDGYGRFVLDGLTVGEKYTVKVLSPDVTGSFVVPESGGDDVDGGVWFATRGFLICLTLSHLEEDWEQIHLAVVPLTGSNAGTTTNMALEMSPDRRVEMRLPSAGTYLVVARDGTGLEAASVVKVSTFDVAMAVDLDFSAGSKIFGTVCDNDGVPIAAADVVIKSVENGASIAAPTNEDGNYRVGILPAGEYVISVSAEGYYQQTGKIIQVDGKDDCLDVDFSLEVMPNELKGSVKLPGGNEWLVVFEDASQAISRSVLTDADGNFSIRRLPTCTGVLSVYDGDDLLLWTDQDVVIDESEKVVTIEGDQLCYMVCRAYSEEGALIPSTWVWTSGTGNEQMANSDDKGESIVAIPRGEYRVSVVADGYVDGVLYRNADESKRVSITLRKAGYCRFALPADVDVGTMELVSFNSSGLHYGGSSFGDGYIVSTALEPGEAQMFAVQGGRAFYSEASTVTGGVTNDVRRLDGAELKIDLSEQNWGRVSTVRIYHRDGSGIVLSREVTSRLVSFSEYPDVALRIEARGVHQEVLATAMRAKGDRATVQLFPSDTVNISGTLQGATFSQLLGATVSFSSLDGHKLREVALSQDGRFVATAVPTAFANLWFSLSDGTAFPVSKTEAELTGYVCTIPDDLGSQVLKIEDKNGNAIVGMPFVVTDAAGNSTVQTTDSHGHLSIRRKSGKQTVTPVDKTSQIEEKQVDVPPFVCPVCRKNPCACPSGSEPKVCEKCGKNPCTCVPESVKVKERNTSAEEVIPQYELPGIRVKYGETLIDDLDFRQWSYWNPSENWACSVEEGLTRYINEYNRVRKSPPPYVAACEERKCTYNKRVYKRYLKAQRDFLDEYDRVSAALEDALARSRQCRRLLRNTANGELGSAYVSYMTGSRIQAPCGAGYGEQLYVGTTRSVISSGPSAVAGYANAREEGVLNPAEGMNREGGESIAQNIVGEAGEAVFEHADNFGVKAGGGAVAVASGPVQSFNAVYDDHVRYRNEMERRISEFGGMFANLEAKLQYYMGAVNTPYHECMRIYSPYDTPYAMYTSPMVIYRVPIVQSCDPNEMAGPMGVGDPETERFVRPGEWLTYTVYFENQSNATAAAQEVYVTNPLSEWLDLDSFEMGEVAFNNQVDLGLVGKQNGSCETDLAGTAYRVQSNVTLDKELSTVGWYLRIVDPTTPAEWPEDPYAGFLMPNDETHCGEGHLTYRIKVREDAPRNTMITNLASIVFDYNEAIETDPFWWNIAGWPFTLGEAVNNETLEWMTGGAAEWLPTWDDCAADGLHDAVVTGIGNNTNTWIKTVVEGPGTVSFAWCGALASRNTKVQFLVDGTVEAILSGSNDWESVSVTVYGEGEHELTWKMQTGRSGASADDFAALDCVGWSPTEPPTLEEALNADLVWNVDGDAEWHGVARDSLVSVREAWASVSGLGDYEYAAVETRVYGSGTLRFDWAVSCEEGYDELILFVDGKSRKSITGEVGWKTDAVEITGKAWHTVRWEYVKDDLDEPELVGNNRAMLDNVAWDSDDELWLPTIVGDEGATVTGDAETGFVVKPSEGKTAVEVTIPHGVEAAKVTVEVSPKVASVKPNGAKVKIVSGGADITEFLNVPVVDGNGVVDLAKATVREEIVKEMLDPKNGAEIRLNAADPKLKTAPTRAGLFYQFREGETLEGMKDGDSKVGDGQSWSPKITVKGGNSAFYSIGVGKGE